MPSWNEVSQRWDRVPDFSQAIAWKKENGTIYEGNVPPGVPLPAELTVVAPPSDLAPPLRWNETSEEWMRAPDAR